MSPSHHETILQFWELLDTRDYDALRGLLSENFTMKFLPSSMGELSANHLNTENFVNFMKSLHGVIKSFKMEVMEFIDAKDVVVAHYRSTGELAKGGPYTNEYIGIFRFEGEKLRSLQEFLDSKYTAEVLAVAK